jgi:hypothetical protein
MLLLVWLFVLPVGASLTQSFRAETPSAGSSCSRTRKECCCRKSAASGLRWAARVVCEGGCLNPATVVPTAPAVSRLIRLRAPAFSEPATPIASTPRADTFGAALVLLQRPPPALLVFA